MTVAWSLGCSRFGFDSLLPRPPYAYAAVWACLVLMWAWKLSAQGGPQQLRPVPDPAFAARPLVEVTTPKAETGAAEIQMGAICPPRGVTIDATCVRVIDGDTIVCRTTLDYHVRLLDCWAPESRTRDAAEKQLGLRAKARMQELVAGKAVRVHLPSSSGDLADAITLGRVLGRVWLMDGDRPAGPDLSAAMVREGFAKREKPPNLVTGDPR